MSHLRERTGFAIAATFGILLTVLSGCTEREAYKLLEQAHHHEGVGQEEKALEAYAKAAATSPEDAYLQRALGRAYLRRQDWDQATESLREAIRLEPAYLYAYQDLISASLRQDDTETALTWLEMAARAIPNYAPLYERLVTFYAAHDSYDEALDILNELVAEFPNEAWIPFRRGTILRQTSQPDEALESYERAVDIDPELPDLWAEIGNTQFDREAYDEAEEAFIRAIELDPHDHRSMNNLAWLYAVRGINLDVGIELSRASLELREEPSYIDTLAELYYKQGDRRRALILIQRALRMDTDSEDLRSHLEKQLERFRQPHGRI